jgi:hypothetical protein
VTDFHGRVKIQVDAASRNGRNSLCVPVDSCSANPIATSMVMDQLRCVRTAGIYATIVTDHTIRNGSNPR